MDGSRNIRQTETQSEEPSNPIPILPSMPTDERSAGTLPMANIHSGLSEGGFMKEGEVAIPQELGSLRLGILPADADPGKILASQPMETGKGLTNQSPVSISEPLIFARPMGRQSSPPLSPPLMKDVEYSHTPQDPGVAAGSQSKELPAWIETMKSPAPGDLNKIDKVRSHASQGAGQIGKNLQAGSEAKPLFRSDFPTAERIGLEEGVGELKVTRARPPLMAQNPEEGEASLFETVFGKSSDHPAGSLNPADQAFAR